MVVPPIIQVMDDHFHIETQGDMGILHFKKPPIRGLARLKQLKMLIILLLMTVSKVNHE